MKAVLVLAFITAACASARTNSTGKYYNPQELSPRPLKPSGSSDHLTFLGAFGTKAFFVGYYHRSQADAQKVCESYDLTLAKLESQEELEGLYDLTSMNEDHAWTGGISSFSHGDGSNIAEEIGIHAADVIPQGLTLFRFEVGSSLYAMPATELRYYICYG